MLLLLTLSFLPFCRYLGGHATHDLYMLTASSTRPHVPPLIFESVLLPFCASFSLVMPLLIFNVLAGNSSRPRGKFATIALWSLPAYKVSPGSCRSRLDQYLHARKQHLEAPLPFRGYRAVVPLVEEVFSWSYRRRYLHARISALRSALICHRISPPFCLECSSCDSQLAQAKMHRLIALPDVKASPWPRHRQRVALLTIAARTSVVACWCHLTLLLPLHEQILSWLSTSQRSVYLLFRL